LTLSVEDPSRFRRRRADRWPPRLPSVEDLARDARHLGGERTQLIDQSVIDGLFELENFRRANVDGDLLGQIAIPPPRWSPRRDCAPDR